MALSDTQRGCDFTSALKAEPEMSGRGGSAASVENDPSLHLAANFAVTHNATLW